MPGVQTSAWAGEATAEKPAATNAAPSMALTAGRRIISLPLRSNRRANGWKETKKGFILISREGVEAADEAADPNLLRGNPQDGVVHECNS